MSDQTNWAGNYRYQAEQILHPASIAELQDAVAGAASIRALGTRHSFNDLPDTTGALVSVDRLPQEVAIDVEKRTVTVPAAMRYGDVGIRLHEQGWGLGNLASLPHICVAGAIATGTHGSGNRNGNLSSAVAAIEFVDGTGELVTLRRGDPDFGGAVVAVGALGVTTAVTLDIRPTFQLSQRVYTDLRWDRVLTDFDAITDNAYSVSLFTNWQGETVSQVWVKSAIGAHTAADSGAGSAVASASASPADDEFFGARAATVPLHMLPGMSPDNCTQQLGVAGPWHERLPHFKLAFTPSNGEEIQSEYLMDRRHAAAAAEALRPLGELLAPVLQVTEIRTMAADDLWLSPAFGADTVAFHFTWLRDQAGVEAVLPAIEAALAPFAARPHWGKAFIDVNRVVSSLYPRMADFRRLAQRHDPRGVFRNEFLERHVFG
ncbi:FAD-binding protein [Rathayibacter soli]|uniref:FAD-binding protein n=1 Tax=Rathayibacter soli TaxID=3144168 RepID=UPI0027E54C04|nr:FAD-binding protein [Glaciibacter superstes]